MGRTPTFLNDVIATLTSKTAWHQRLPKDVADELDEVRASFRKGLLLGKPYQVAAAVSKAAKARGVELPSDKVIVKWLKSDD